jgi:hypothetical protein
MLQTFCIPVSSDDPDAASTKLRKTEAAAEPVQGWEAWVRDIIEMMGVCESKQAVRSVQSRRRWVRRHSCCVQGCNRLPIECAHVRSHNPIEQLSMPVEEGMMHSQNYLCSIVSLIEE